MAVLDESTKKTTNEDGFRVMKAININDTNLKDGAVQKINPDQDAWDKARPPEDGVYLLQLYFNREEFSVGEDENTKEPIYQANLDCKIRDNPKYDKVVIFGKVNTSIPAGKDVSTMASMLRKMGVKVPTEIKPLELARMFKKVLSQEPRLYCEGEWKAWDQGEKRYAKQGMDTFPNDPDMPGQKLHIIRAKDGTQISANWKPMRWYGLKEYRAKVEADKQNKAAQQQGQSTKGAGAGGDEVVMDVPQGQGNFQPVSAPSAPTGGGGDDNFTIDE